MLQQTRVETVVPYYERFLAAMPTVRALAEAPVDRVLELWSGLGYYRRARLLHRGARDVVDQHGGSLPRDAKTLQSISGVGRYTAGAIASIAFGEEAPLVDGNVARVLSRLAARKEDPASPKGKRALWAMAEELAAGESPGDANQALMELGATVCTPKSPACDACPVARSCLARARGIENELPRVTPKAKGKRVTLRAFVVEHRGGLVFGKRREGALYGGMWEPPMLGKADDAKALLGVDESACEARGQIVHVLTHRRLEVDVLYMQARRAPKISPFGDYDAFELVPRGAFEGRALSTLARRTLETAIGRQTHFRSL